MKKDFKLPSLAEARKRDNQEAAIQTFSFDPSWEKLGVGKRYFIVTHGCQANERDSEVLAGIIEKMGYTPATTLEEAQLILLNTCAIRQGAEDHVYGEIGNLKILKAQDPSLIIGVCGCMAQEEVTVARLRSSYPWVNLVFGTHNLAQLPRLLAKTIQEGRQIEVMPSGCLVEGLPSHRALTHKAWVNIMVGCDKFCTYCIVPYTRGKQRSRPMGAILEEVRSLQVAGYKEITLLGQNVNAYGKDFSEPIPFSTLLEAVAQTGIPRIRFTTSHPWDFEEKIIDLMAQYPNLMPWLHLPVQSGNNEMLKKMGRRYTREQYLHLAKLYREKLPHGSLTTDIIVGFPNETAEQFEDTLSLVEACDFDLAYTFIYSPRVGTPAAKFEDTIPLEEKENRLALLNQRVGEMGKRHNEAWLNKEVVVLCDGPSKKNETVWCGYTEDNRLVNFTGSEVKVGDLVPVQITEVRSWSLLGEKGKTK